jgi:hypothetical protein
MPSNPKNYIMYTNCMMQNKTKLKKHKKKIRNKILKLLNYKYLLKKKTLNLKK